MLRHSVGAIFLEVLLQRHAPMVGGCCSPERPDTVIKSKLPQFKPQWDAKKGAEQLYQAYLSSGLTLEEFEGPRYQRIAHIKKLMAEGILASDLRHTTAERLAG
jgi:hypothetical protein